MDRWVPARASTPTTAPRARLRALLSALVAIGLISATMVVAAKTVSTSSARVAASTSTGGFLTAGTVDIVRADGNASLLFDADNLYPGRVVVGCVVLEYGGSVPAALRLHGDRGRGTGLDDYVDLTLTTSARETCPTEHGVDDVTSADPAEELFRGRLSELWSEHATYATGVDLATSVVPGDRLVIEAVAVVVDDDRAAGLTTDFVLTIEGRPT